jgi:hypothetical protein
MTDKTRPPEAQDASGGEGPLLSDDDFAALMSAEHAAAEHAGHGLDEVSRRRGWQQLEAKLPRASDGASPQRRLARRWAMTGLAAALVAIALAPRLLRTGRIDDDGQRVKGAAQTVPARVLAYAVAADGSSKGLASARVPPGTTVVLKVVTSQAASVALLAGEGEAAPSVRARLDGVAAGVETLIEADGRAVGYELAPGEAAVRVCVLAAPDAAALTTALGDAALVRGLGGDACVRLEPEAGP